MLKDILSREVDRLEELATGNAEVTGTPSGFTDLDKITGGFQPGNLIILAARPGMGKSGLVANIAEHVASRSAARSPSSRSRCRTPSSPSA